MTFKQLSPTEWDAQREPFDCGSNDTAVSCLPFDCARDTAAASPLRVGFHVRLERDEYVVDVFDTGIDNPDDAYLTTHTCETWEQVERYCRDYDGKTVV